MVSMRLCEENRVSLAILALFLSLLFLFLCVVSSSQPQVVNLTCISDRPVTYLYNTLHYYELKVRERTSLKRRLVFAVLGSLQDSKVTGFGLSEPYQKYMQGPTESWTPELDYFMWLIQRICDSIL